MSNAAKIVSYLELSDAARAALLSCLATRGPRKGYLTRRPPRYGTPEYAAWQAATLVSNPLAARTMSVVCARLHHPEIHDEILRALDSLPVSVSAWFSHDRVVLSRLGVY